MDIGPVEYLVVGFPGNKFTGQIAPALADLIESDTIRLIDLVFVTKDAQGNVAAIEYDALEELAAFVGLEGEVGGLISDTDIAHVGASLEPNNSAGILIWEDRWAAPFVQALRDADCVLLEGARVPHEIVEAVAEAVAEELAAELA
jgi:translation initiation factor IF-2